MDQREGGRGVPGVVGLEGWLGGLYRVLPSPSQYPDLVIFLPQDPTHGQMKAISRLFMRFPRTGLDRVLELTRIDPESTLQDPSQTWSRDALRSPISQTSETYGQNKALFNTLLTVADILGVRSKDWIRPPTCSQE